MVMMPEGYSIDSTEVTRCQYQAWLDTKPPLTGQDPWCGWNQDFTPWSSAWPEWCWPPGDRGNEPVSCVDWCDAFAYCKAVGKRLCGKIGGGANVKNDKADPAKSQWFNACSSGGKYKFPYGNDFDHGALCNDSKNVQTDGLAPVATLTGCRSPEDVYTGVYDLSGTVWAWEDSCTGSVSGQDLCLVRGGSMLSPESTASCAASVATLRNEPYTVVGFRCCSL
jgi:formylglycine-generating enzyme required for sulfatase activity